MNWQPIKTAPKGERILLWCDEHQCAVLGMWASYHGGTFYSDEEGRELRPTHWFPLPRPPGDGLCQTCGAPEPCRCNEMDGLG